MAKETVVIAEPVEVDEGCAEDIINPGGGAFLSDAILKPRIVFMDGFGAGKWQENGSFDLTDNVTLKYVQDRYFGRSSGSTTSAIPLTGPDILTFDLFDPTLSWTWSQTGGRGGGFIVSKTDSALSNGQFKYCAFPQDNTSRGGGVCLGMDLQGTPITSEMFIAAFVATVGGLTFGIHSILSILPDYTVRIRRFIDLGILATSILTVPISGPFTIEAGIFVSTFTSNGVTILPQTNGFCFARLYLPGGDPTGQELCRVLNVQTASVNVSSIVGVLYGSDARASNSTGKGVAGIKFDGVVCYDGMGTIKRYLYDTRVGSLMVNATGDSSQSTQVFGGLTHGVALAYQNVDATEQANPYSAPVYNFLKNGNIDLYKIPTVKTAAVDILAISPFITANWWQHQQFSPGADAVAETVQEPALGWFLLIKDGGIVYAGGDIRPSNQNNIGVNYYWVATANCDIYELQPSTGLKWSPTSVAIVQIGIKAKTNSMVNVALMGMDYVYRETIILDEEHGPFSPICDFVTSATANDHDWTFNDASIDWDGIIDHTKDTWDFGDGSAIVTGVSSTTHNYIPGSYTVTHTVTDNDGLVASKTLAITVPNDLPVANFSATGTGEDATFTDTSTDSDGTIVGWDWDFGDGSPHSNLQNPTHTYPGAATYSVTLVVTDNNGGTNSVTANVTTPLGAAPDCALSSDFAANTAFVQGDDYNGGNPPLPAYANTAAFENYYTGVSFREAYDSAIAGASDGTNYIIDNVLTFNGHNTLKMAYGKPAATTYSGAGWNTVLTDDGDPVETYYTAAPFGPLAQWFWLRLKAANPVMLDVGATTAFTGLGLIEINGKNFEVAVMNRQGRIKVDISHCTTLHGAFVIDTFDIAAESAIFGSGQMNDLLVLVNNDDTAHTIQARVWIGTACSMAGVSPIMNQTLTSFSHSVAGDSTGLAISGPVHTWFDAQFTPSGALNYINVAGWMTVPLATEANPAGVALT